MTIEGKIYKKLTRARENSKGLFNKYEIENYNFDRRTLRINLMGEYKRELRLLTPRSMSISDIVSSTNVPYQKRTEYPGIFYPHEYIELNPHKLYNKDEKFSSIQGLANNYYWDLSVENNYFKTKYTAKPSDAIKSFFLGKTFADCGNVIMASIYRYILGQVGDEKFDEMFGNPLIQFCITPYLYNQYIDGVGNPLYFLFDKIESSNDLHNGDIVHIQGVEKYKYKHLFGFGQGWNLVVVKKKKNKYVKFIGFGPDEFKKPLTFSELKKLLIDSYNKPQLKETTMSIERNLKKDPSTLEYTKAFVAQDNKDNVVSYDSDIVGFVGGIRLNKKKLADFIRSFENPHPWFSMPKFITPTGKSVGVKILTEHGNLPQENINSTFESYQVTNNIQQQIKNICYNFASDLITKKGPFFCCLQGNVGIGKTHLMTAVLNFVSKNKIMGKTPSILFINENYIKDYFQNNGKLFNYKQVLDGVDLIVFDDINSNFGCGIDFLEIAFQYILENNKSLIVSSNVDIDFNKVVKNKLIYESPILDQFFVFSNITMESYRKPWCQNLFHLEDKIQSLVSHHGHTAGIIVNGDLEVVKQLYQKLVPKAKIRVAYEPYRHHRVFDMHMHDIAEYDTFLINVNGTYEVEQLLNLIEKIHQQNSKLIVVTNDFEHLISIFKEQINEINIKEKLFDRTRIILPGLV